MKNTVLENGLKLFFTRVSPKSMGEIKRIHGRKDQVDNLSKNLAEIVSLAYFKGMQISGFC